MNDISERELLQALETLPSVTVPADFTQRVMSRLPPRAKPSYRPLLHGQRTEARVGSLAMVFAGGALLLFMVMLPLLVSNHETFLAVDALLFVNLAALVLYTFRQQTHA